MTAAGSMNGGERTSGLDLLALMPTPSAPPLCSTLEAELAQLAPVRTRRPTRQLAILAAVSSIYAGALLALFTVRRDAAELPSPWLIGAAVGWFAAFALASGLAVVPGRGDVMPRWPRGAIATGVLAVAFVALGWFVHPSGPSSTTYGWGRFLHGHTCLELGVGVAVVPVVIGTIALRGVLVVQSRWVAATLGAGGGCLGGLLLHFHCPIADAPHIAFMHGGVVLLSALLAATLVPRVTDRPLR